MRSPRINDPRAKMKLERLQAFVSNPLLQIFVMFLAFVGTIFSLLGWLVAIQRPDFVCAEGRSRSLISTKSHVAIVPDQIENQPLWVCRIAFWNRGGSAIRQSDILDPVSLDFKPPVLIVGVAIGAVTREVVRPVAILSKPDSVSVQLGWQVLEENDGFEVQLVCAGPIDAQLDAEGTIVGQRELSQVELGRSTTWPWVAIVGGLLLAWLVLTMYFDTKKNPPPAGMEWAAHSYHWLGAIYPFLAAAWGAYKVIETLGTVPPFPF